MNSSAVHIISAVRDFSMYDQCVGKNPFLRGCMLHPVDNRQENAHVSTCYNRFLNAYDYRSPAWFVFCHEDFQVRENLVGKLQEADPACICGPIGVEKKIWFKWFFGGYVLGRVLGKYEQCSKDGTGVCVYGAEAAAGSVVDTFDCCCLIVHSTLVDRCRLRFDENLSFDLYAEDFSINAWERHAIRSVLLPMKVRHWSCGMVQERYYQQEEYLAKKYPNAGYVGVVSERIGGGTLLWQLQIRSRKILERHFGFCLPIIHKFIAVLCER